MEKANMSGSVADENSGGKQEAASQPDAHLEAYSQFTVGQKRSIVAMGSLASFFSPLSSSIYLPALTTIAHALLISTSQVNLTVTTYLVSGMETVFEMKWLIFSSEDYAGCGTHVHRRFF
jgi:hypothetical protein